MSIFNPALEEIRSLMVRDAREGFRLKDLENAGKPKPPAPAPSELGDSFGRCSVCASQTVFKCTACAEYGIHILFCSIDCKKFVWFLHKRVCGPRANPFQYPGFSREEIKEAAEFSQKSIPLPNGESMNLLSFGQDTMGLENPEESFRATLEAFKEKRGERRDESSTPELFHLRDVNMRTATTLANFEHPDWTDEEREIYAFTHFPFAYMQAWLSRLLPGLPTHENGYAPWSSRIQHLFLILTACLVNFYLEPNASGERKEFLKKAVDNAQSSVKWFGRFMKDTHPYEHVAFLMKTDLYPSNLFYR